MCRMTLLSPLNNNVDARLVATLAAAFVDTNSLESGQDDGAGLCAVSKVTTAYNKSGSAGYNFVAGDEWSDGLNELIKAGKVTKETVWLGHVRQASPGIKVDISNSHPFVVGTITGMHNGVIRNKTDFDKTTDSDSEAFFKYLAQQAGNKPVSYDLLKESLEKVRGAFCMLINDRNNPDPTGVWVIVGKARDLYMWQNENFLLINTSERGFEAIGRLKQILKTLGDKRHTLLEFTGKAVKLKAETIFFLSGNVLKEIGPVKEKDYQTSSSSYGWGESDYGKHTVSRPTSVINRKCARIWAEILGMMELEITDGTLLVEALLDLDGVRSWTSLDEKELEKIKGFAQELSKNLSPTDVETKWKLWCDITSIAKAKHSFDYLESDLYTFLEFTGENVQFPYWINSMDRLNRVKFALENMEARKPDDERPTL